MLKLLSLRKNQNEASSPHEMEKNPSHELIDDLIAQIKYVHLEEVWQARLHQLMQPFDGEVISKRKNLKIL